MTSFPAIELQWPPLPQAFGAWQSGSSARAAILRHAATLRRAKRPSQPRVLSLASGTVRRTARDVNKNAAINEMDASR